METEKDILRRLERLWRPMEMYTSKGRKVRYIWGLRETSKED